MYKLFLAARRDSLNYQSDASSQEKAIEEKAVQKLAPFLISFNVPPLYVETRGNRQTPVHLTNLLVPRSQHSHNLSFLLCSLSLFYATLPSVLKQTPPLPLSYAHHLSHLTFPPPPQLYSFSNSHTHTHTQQWLPKENLSPSLKRRLPRRASPAACPHVLRRPPLGRRSAVNLIPSTSTRFSSRSIPTLESLPRL